MATNDRLPVVSSSCFVVYFGALIVDAWWVAIPFLVVACVTMVATAWRG